MSGYTPIFGYTSIPWYTPISAVCVYVVVWNTQHGKPKNWPTWNTQHGQKLELAVLRFETTFQEDDLTPDLMKTLPGLGLASKGVKTNKQQHPTSMLLPTSVGSSRPHKTKQTSGQNKITSQRKATSCHEMAFELISEAVCLTEIQSLLR
jgi:hypothetical protein